MTSLFLRAVLRQHAEDSRPDNMDLWPAIREEVQRRHSQNGSSAGYRAVVERPRVRPHERRANGPNAAPHATPSWLNMPVALVALLALAGVVTTFLLGNRFQVASPQVAEDHFLPAGKVRHMIYTGTRTVNGRTTEQHREEFWLTAGKSHPMMRDNVTVPVTVTAWLVDDAYYEYEPGQENQVHEYPYDSKYLAAVLPDAQVVSRTLQLPNARLVGNDTLNGRPVVVITAPGEDVPSLLPPGNSGAISSTTRLIYWIDRETNQILKVSSVVTPPTTSTDPVETTINEIVLDELIDRSTLPADFFEFQLPPGATVVQEPPASSTSTPAP